MLKTFSRGGIHPGDFKEMTKDKAIERLPLPKKLLVSLSQSIGAPTKLVVEVDSHVVRGQLVAEKGGFVSANIHAPADGTVKAIRTFTTPQGGMAQAVEIETDNPGSFPDNSVFVRKTDEQIAALTGKELVSLIEKAGLVGMGGATFPANVKFSVPEGKRVEFFLINCCECEPYLNADYRLLVERKQDIIEGIELLQRVFNPDYTYFCTEENKQEEALKLDSMKGDAPFELQILQTKYPQGDEKSIINAVTGRFVPSGKLPLDIGCVVVNLGTLLAVHDAVYFEKPCIERVVTVSGAGVVEPKNILAPIGTLASDMLDFCGGINDGANKFISGGPMMGFAFYDMDTPVTKGTSGITVLKDVQKKQTSVCISCGRCAEACPIGLMPTLMYKYIAKGKVEDAIKIHLLDCRECGCCDYSCPAAINLVQEFKLGKKLWRAMKK